MTNLALTSAFTLSLTLTLTLNLTVPPTPTPLQPSSHAEGPWRDLGAVDVPASWAGEGTQSIYVLEHRGPDREALYRYL